MKKPYALHSLLTALIHCRYGIEEVTQDWGVLPLHRFAANGRDVAERLLALAQAHEAKERAGPYAPYVWGCLGGTKRAPRRTARRSEERRVGKGWVSKGSIRWRTVKSKNKKRQ